MAVYYGQCKGNGTAATRTGTKGSGIRASVQSYNGSLIASLYNGKVTLEIAKDSNFTGKEVFCGTLKELENILMEAK